MTLDGGRKAKAQLAELGHIVTGAHPEHEAPIAQAVDIGGPPGDQERVTVVNTADQGHEP